VLSFFFAKLYFHYNSTILWAWEPFGFGFGFFLFFFFSFFLLLEMLVSIACTGRIREPFFSPEAFLFHFI